MISPEIVVIGSSTGGPRALETIFQDFKTIPKCPIVVVQHMPPLFTKSLAERLEKVSSIPAKESLHGEVLQKGVIYIAPGDFHLTLQKSHGGVTAALDQKEKIHSVRPAVDKLFASASSLYKEKCLGIVLTGMGFDGAAGAQKIKANHGAVVTQDQESCIVYGMPRAVVECGAYDRSLDLQGITGLLKEKVK